jgi:hypothetical protein
MAKVSSVKLIGLEEHFVTNDVLAAWKVLEPRWQDVALELSDEGETGRRLADLGDERFAAMEETGLDVQVLSLTAPGVQSLTPADATATSDRIERFSCGDGPVELGALPGVCDARDARSERCGTRA